jgi:hypothetical protein
VFEHPGRFAIVAIAMFVVINLAILALHTSDQSTGGRQELPPTVLSVSPEPASLAGPVNDIVIDLHQAYPHFDLVVDGVDVQQDSRNIANEITFRPGPNKALTRYRPGDNTVVVYFWTQATAVRPAHAGSFGWTFRVAA